MIRPNGVLMKLTKSQLTFFIAILIVLFCVWLKISPETESKIAPSKINNASFTHDISQQNDKSHLYFQVNIESSVQDNTQTILTHSSLQWAMTIVPTQKPDHYIGHLSEIKFEENKQPTILPSELTFKINYDDKRFHTIDLLGLPKVSTLNVITHVLNLMSYDDYELTFEDDIRRQVYEYNKRGTLITRKTRESHYKVEQQIPSQEQEGWELELDINENISSMVYENTRLWEQSSAQYTVTQSVNVIRLNQAPTSLAFNITHNMNAHFDNNERNEESFIKIENKQMLFMSIKQLKSSFDPKLAREIGDYLVLHYSAFELSELLSENVGSSSAIIYALQKHQSQEAEQILVDLLSVTSLNDMNKHRIAIALGRFGSSSEVSLMALTKLSKSENQVADTALLSIGTMAYFTPEKAHSVTQLLRENIIQGESLATTVLAVANSKEPELIDEIPPLLSHEDEMVKLNAIKVLTKQGAYQDMVVTALINSPKTKFVDAFVRTFSETNQILTKNNFARLQKVLSETKNPIVEDKLSKFLVTAS